MSHQPILCFLLWLHFVAHFIRPVLSGGGSDSSRYHRGGSSSSHAEERERRDSFSFPERFGFTDPVSGRPMTEAYYDHIAQLAPVQIDRPNYYSLNWHSFHTGAYARIRDSGGTGLPSDLPKHSNYLDYLLGDSHIPTIFVRVADALPDNPMGAYNPDIMVYMHAVRVSRDNDARYQLEPKLVLRGRSQDAFRSTRKVPAYDVVWENAQAYRRNHNWISDVPRVLWSPSLADVERLGYTPSTIERQVALLPRESASSLYSSYPTDRMVDLLEQSRQYIAQFASSKRMDDLMWYGLMSAQVDGEHRPDPWFQAPIFRRFDLASGQAQLKTYVSNDEALPVLDRVLYTLSRSGQARLVPRAIVRPVKVVPEMRFETVYRIPTRLREEASVDLAYFPRLERPALTEAEQTRPLKLLMDRPRPMGHPLDLIASKPLSHSAVGRRRRSAKSSRRISLEQAEQARTYRPSRPPLHPSITAEVNDIKREDARRLDSRQRMRFSPSEDAERAPWSASEPIEEPSILVPSSPELVHGLETPDPASPKPTTPVHAQLGSAQADRNEYRLIEPPRSEHRPASPPVQPREQLRNHRLRYDGPNPYETAPGDALDVLMAHLNPHVEDAWRYGRP